MKNYLKTSYFINIFPQNPTQTKYLRFLKYPWSPLTSQFEKSQKEWDKIMKDVWRTRYLEEGKDALL